LSTNIAGDMGFWFSQQG